MGKQVRITTVAEIVTIAGNMWAGRVLQLTRVAPEPDDTLAFLRALNEALKKEHPTRTYISAVGAERVKITRLK